MSKLHIFIGGVHGPTDYEMVSAIDRFVFTEVVRNWAGNKDAKTGDRVLLYFPAKRAIVASAMVVGSAYRTKRPGDFRYRVPISDIRLLSPYLSHSEVQRRFPRWRWPTYGKAGPRGRVHVPERIADRLWEMAL